MFATHYHELTKLGEKKGIRNFNIAVREWGEKIIFLRKIMEGGTNRSYGIQVARLAGVPAEVIAIDGQTLRRSHQKKGGKAAIHMVKKQYLPAAIAFSE